MNFPDFIKPVVLTVTGGREYADRKRLFAILDTRAEYWMQRRPDARIFLVQGGARGADDLAKSWAESREQAFATIPAEWNREGYGKKAGHLRNTQMLSWFHPTELIAFPGGTGTADAVAKAKQYGVPVLLIQEGAGSSYWEPGAANEAPAEPALPSYWRHDESDCYLKAETAEDAERYANEGCAEVLKEDYDKWIASTVDDLI